jgi:pantoate--beta-alanine ligase
MVLSSMVREFALPIEVIPGETVRAPDGLALSSRNGYLSEAERAEAPRLHRLLRGVVEALRAGNPDYAGLERAALAELQASGWVPDYLAIRRKFDLQSATAHDSGLVVLAAARLGSTRLIDNLEV